MARKTNVVTSTIAGRVTTTPVAQSQPMAIGTIGTDSALSMMFNVFNASAAAVQGNATTAQESLSLAANAATQGINLSNTMVPDWLSDQALVEYWSPQGGMSTIEAQGAMVNRPGFMIEDISTQGLSTSSIYQNLIANDPTLASAGLSEKTLEYFIQGYRDAGATGAWNALRSAPGQLTSQKNFTNLLYEFGQLAERRGGLASDIGEATGLSDLREEAADVVTSGVESIVESGEAFTDNLSNAMENIGDTLEGAVEDITGAFELPDIPDISVPGLDGAGGFTRRTNPLMQGQLNIPIINRQDRGYLSRRHYTGQQASVSNRTLLGGQ